MGREGNVPVDVMDDAPHADVVLDEAERQRRIAVFVAWANQITGRELQRRVRYLVSAMSPDQIAHQD